ncbi:MAG TPA: hypothetical protein VF268_15305, partial [Gammaproteobacteria bacterium]
MSLLLDALKKAAQEKLEKQGGQADSISADDKGGPVSEREHDPVPSEPAVPKPSDDSEEVLELEPLEDEDIELSIDPDALTEPSDTDYRYRRSQVLASELRAFNNNSEFEGGDTATDAGGHHPDWSVEPIDGTYWNSPMQAAKVFSSKSPDRNRRLFFIAGGAGVVALLAGTVVAYRHFISTDDDFLVVMSRPEPVDPVATTDSAVDPTLLIEQEDYGSLLASDSEAPAVTDTNDGPLPSRNDDPPVATPESQPAPPAENTPVRRQTGFDEGELKIRRTGAKEPLQNVL